MGKICWLEIPVKDIYRAQKFYTDIFSWDCDPEPKDPVQYPTSSSDTVDSPIQSLHFFRKGEALNGAFMLGKADHQVVNYDPNRPRALPLLPTIHIEDCADTLRKAEALGGKTTW